MISIELLRQIVSDQRNFIELRLKDTILRDKTICIHDTPGFASIVSGVRRCGKSTLLLQYITSHYGNAFFINFDDPRLFDFNVNDFVKIDRIITESNTNVILLDEVQLITGWERYVRQKLDSGYKVFITGSNASLLSKELGTSLTGRHLTMELFPFSFKEFCTIKNITSDTDAMTDYLTSGGFPDFIKYGNADILVNLLDDILVRDIAVRYGIRDINSLKRLTTFLLSNIGNLTSANKLREPSGINSTSTVIEYISHLEQSYLISMLPMWDYSVKKQNVNPKKIYAIDLGLVNANVSRIKNDIGHKLENVVFNSLRAQYPEIYYHKGTGECDFLVVEANEITQAIQVCYTLDENNIHREIDGLVDAMETHGLNNGTIVTMSQTDEYESNGKRIHVIPAHRFLLPD